MTRLKQTRNSIRRGLRCQAQRIILESAPDYKQRNAALGLLSDAEAQEVRDAIAAVRTAYDARLAEVDAILAGDGTDLEKLRALRSFDARLIPQ